MFALSLRLPYLTLCNLVLCVCVQTAARNGSSQHLPIEYRRSGYQWTMKCLSLLCAVAVDHCAVDQHGSTGDSCKSLFAGNPVKNWVGRPKSCWRVVLKMSLKVSVGKKNQLDVTFCILYFSSNNCSTCFGQPCAHHQELTTAWCYSLPTGLDHLPAATAHTNTRL